MKFHKYHALGNDYLVLDPADFPDWKDEPPVRAIRTLCHRNFGIGSDGILWGPLPAHHAEFGLRIFNPDGSEAEKSGNGLRIFSRYLLDQKRADSPGFRISTPGGVVAVGVDPLSRAITIDMGAVSFHSSRVPVKIAGTPREVLEEPIQIEDRSFRYSAATVGNPHCVICVPEVNASLAQRYGPSIEVHPFFPRRTNVQFLQVIDRTNIRIEIWERGAGYTLASGSSSSAAAAVAHRLGHVDRKVRVHMPGGEIGIEISEGYAIRMTGPVTRIGSGDIDPACLAR